MIFFEKKLYLCSPFYMKVFKHKEMYIWILVSILSPIVLPLFFALLMNIPIDTGKNWLDMVKMLWSGGAYIFLGLFVLFSLLPHFFETSQSQRNVSAIVLYCIITIIVLLITCMLYISHLSLIKDGRPFSENLNLSIVVTISGIIIAIFFKSHFLKGKTNNHIINQNISISD